MKKLVLCLALIIPIICQAQFINQDPHSNCKYRIGEAVVIPFDQMVGLWVVNSPDRIRDSIAIRNTLKYEFDTVEVQAVIVERFFIEEYGIGYYYISVYDKYGRQRQIPILKTGTTTGKFSAISEKHLRKRPLTI